MRVVCWFWGLRLSGLVERGGKGRVVQKLLERPWIQGLDRICALMCGGHRVLIIVAAVLHPATGLRTMYYH